MSGPRFRDLSGRKFHRLSVIERVESRNGLAARWLCVCECGKQKETDGTRLINGRVRSCGCLQIEELKARSITHGMTRSPTYYSWEAMIRRCGDPNNKDWAHYGGRGISVCERWRSSFSSFLADMGERPIGKTLDRWPDINGNYEPSNCRWATNSEQHSNTRTNRMIEFNGETITLSELSRRCGVYKEKLWGRLNRGWPLEKAIKP